MSKSLREEEHKDGKSASDLREIAQILNNQPQVVINPINHGFNDAFIQSEPYQNKGCGGWETKIFYYVLLFYIDFKKAIDFLQGYSEQSIFFVKIIYKQVGTNFYSLFDKIFIFRFYYIVS